jgi:hypothetical protein
MLNASRVSGTGWVELGKTPVSVVIETCVTVRVDTSGGLIDVAVSTSVILSVTVVIEICAGMVVGTISVEVTGAAVLPEPGMTRFLKATYAGFEQVVTKDMVCPSLARSCTFNW